MPQFDLIGVGTAAGAFRVAEKCGQAGWTFTVVDSPPYGSACALRGCDHKKVLVAHRTPPPTLSQGPLDCDLPSQNAKCTSLFHERRKQAPVVSVMPQGKLVRARWSRPKIHRRLKCRDEVLDLRLTDSRRL
jgi:hypothetical protein